MREIRLSSSAAPPELTLREPDKNPDGGDGEATERAKQRRATSS